MDIRTFAQVIRTGATPTDPITGIVGRIIRGKKPEDFLTLTDDPDRKMVLLTDPDGLAAFVGKTGYEMLMAIGYEPRYAEHKIREGNEFKLVVFPEGGAAKLATWTNVLEMVSDAYPMIAETLAEQQQVLRETPFSEIEHMAGYSFLDVEKTGKSDRRYMTYERYLRSYRTLVDTRAFLYFTIHLRDFYSGDGYTYDKDGNRGVREYIIPNKPLSLLGDHEVIDLAVSLPTATGSASVNNGGVLMSALNIHLLVIDGQNGFMDYPDNVELPVPGAVADMQRVAKLVRDHGRRFKKIHATLDCHQEIHIAHPVWWMDQNGESPPPFTVISAADIRAGTWSARHPSLRKHSLAYAEALETTGQNYLITVWPPHCRIGTWGNNLQADFDEAVREWSLKHFATVNYVTKGSNPFTEHYGALMAEVPDAGDPSTMLNTGVISMLEEADIVLVAGEALSHCVKATVSQIADNIGAEHIRKFHILRDCTSSVPAIPGVVDFPAIAEAWLRDMEKLGMTVTTADSVFA